MKSTSTGRWVSLAWALLLTLAGAVLCFVPLFDLLGYESSLILAALGSLVGVRQGTLVVRRVRERGGGIVKAGVRGHGGRSVDLAERVESAPISTVVGWYLRGLLAAEVLLLPALGLLLLNGLRVRNCNYSAGFGFFLMMPVLSVACAVAVGLGSGLLTRTHRRGLWLGYAVVVVSWLWTLLRFLNTPAIYAYDPFFGYFPGALYDEEVSITAAFFAARALHILLIATTLCFLAVFLDGEELRVRLAIPRRKGGQLLAWALLFIATFALYQNGGRLGIYSDVAAINRYLSSEQATPHFILRYKPGGVVARDVQLLAREHELRYEQLHDLLGIEPLWRSHFLMHMLGVDSGQPRSGPPLVISYLFDSAAEKQRWMGAAHTYVAKPWRREIYLQYESWPHPVLRHELAHVFAGAVGDRFLRLASRYGLPQPGMVEGFAVAADWRSSGDLNGHQLVRSMRQAGFEPPLSAVHGLGFWRLPAGRAYAVAGSFCRYLLEQYGAAPLLDAYRRGGGPLDFAKAFQKPFFTLESDWRRFIDTQPLEPVAQEVARERLRRKAVFQKRCAHDLALRQQAAEQAMARGDANEAVRLLSVVCSDDPDEPQHELDLLEALLLAQRLEDAEQTGQRLLTHPARTPVLEARAASRLGDIAVLRGDLTAAKARYEQAAAGAEAEAAARLTSAKLAALSAAQAAPLLLNVLVGEKQQNPPPLRKPERSDALSIYRLLQAASLEPAQGLPHYILGRLLFEHGDYEDSARELQRSLELGLPDGRFDQQALLLRGQAALLSCQPQDAAAIFSDLVKQIPETKLGKRLDVEDLLDHSRRWKGCAMLPP